MAGAFGFEAGKYDVSMRLADRILADGFSGREQIEQGTGRPTLHVAELLARHLQQPRRT